ncbi:MAG: glycosyltransferase 87 family protein [Vicinamibacteria bacterium]|jgi:hypothetical protein|nr:glycosyltransferase 87 family protein [Vicinamibacteria bacterium]
MTTRRILFFVVLGAFLFLLARTLAPHSIDFIVYHRALQSLLQGRVDLYADDFALDPPMRYVYPPLFVLLTAPLGLLDFKTAAGLWLTLLGLALTGMLALVHHVWRPQDRLRLVLLTLAAPWLLYGLRSGNVHLLVVLLLLAALVAWSCGRSGWAGALLALGGALKVFPLLFLPLLVALKEWRLLTRALAISVALWTAPVLYFGPARTLEIYRQWLTDVGNAERLRRESRLDISLPSACERLLSEADYSRRIDRAYPQVNIVHWDSSVARGVGQALALLVAAGSLVAAVRLGAIAMRERAIAAGSLFVTAQLLIGPYTTRLYLSAWLIPALGLPALVRSSAIARPLRCALLGLGAINLALTLLPGGAAHRAVEAAGADTLLSLALWILSLWSLAALRNEHESRVAPR